MNGSHRGSRAGAYTGPLAVGFALLLAFAAAPVRAQGDVERERGGRGSVLLEVGVLLGGGFFQTDGPADPAGSFTFLYGSAFTGGGFTGGLTAVLDLEKAPVGFGADFLFSTTSTTGFAESATSRREVTLSEQALRLWVPNVRLHVGVPFGQWELAVGPEFVLAMRAATEETVAGISTFEPPIEAATGFGVFFAAQTGLTFELDGFGPFDQVSFPVLVRFGWNPFYPDRTDERFADFAGPDDPGPLTIGASWYVTGLAGIRFGRLL
jgi:hypothetical protein